MRKDGRLAALITALALAGCTAPGPLQPVDPASASPSQYCEALGGKHTVERGSAGEIGVCVFADNRQCEAWALLLGECPRGGIPVSGYATSSERHCAIRGGRMTIPGCALSPVGMYETRDAWLMLQAGRTAMLRAGDAATATLVSGTWHSSGNVVTVSTEQERLVFDYAGDRLVPREWDRRAWGGAGPGTLVRQK
jgi:putative hemolysin